MTVALFLGAATTLSAQDDNRWNLFESMDWNGRVAFLQDPAQQAFGEGFLRDALGLADSSRIETGPEAEVVQKKAVAILLVKKLAALPAPAAIPAIERLPQQYRDPVLRGESWLALAKLGDKAAVPGLVRTLAGLNDSGERTRAEEIQAWYLVQSLGVFKAPEAFRTVAATTLGWYTPASQVRVLAKKTLPTLVTDPEAATLDLLTNDEDLALREGIFLGVVDQGDPALSARAAAAVLTTLVRLQARDKTDQDRTQRLVLESLVAAQKASSPPAALVPPLKLLLTRGDSLESMVQSVRLLGKIDDPAALHLLEDTLSAYNDQQKAGSLSSNSLVVVRELFTALAQTGKAEARTVLDAVRFAGYTPAVIHDAQDALDKLPR
jgi:hypothetical protein